MSPERAVVFLVEDDEGVRRSLGVLLQMEGWDVVEYESPLDFLDDFEPPATACLVLDVHLPGMSGLAVHERLVERGVKLPTIFLTGHAPPPMTDAARARGVVAVFEKPCPPERLIDAVKQALASNAD